MNKILVGLVLSLVFVLESTTHAQQSICAYEKNIDYYISNSITYVYTKAPEFCCSLCGIQPGCVGNKRKKLIIELN